MQHPVASKEEWLEARIALLKEEKELTRQSDELAKRRQALPWKRVDKDYQFDTEAGNASLAELFQQRSQLLIYHFMFGENYTAGCPSCSAIADGFNGIAIHLAHHDVTLIAVSHAPLAKLTAFKRRMGWTFPWASSFGGDFNFDFSASFTEQQQRAGIEYNYRKEKPFAGPANGKTAPAPKAATDNPVAQMAATTGTDTATYIRERPGMSTFAQADGAIYHCYSAYSRGLDSLWNMFQWLDRAPQGRNESGIWWRRHDEYDSAPPTGNACCQAAKA